MAKGDSWTLEQLVQAVAAALTTMDPLRKAGSPPSPRTVRYYTDVGVIDAPSGRRGLNAIYGQRHFLQLLAIKRLQAQGLPLSDIRAQVASAPTSRLKDLAKPGVPIAESSSLFPGEIESPLNAELRRPRERSLMDEYTPVAEGSAGVQGIVLPGGVIVVLPLTRALSGAERESLRQAAEPLVALASSILTARGRAAEPDHPEE